MVDLALQPLDLLTQTSILARECLLLAHEGRLGGQIRVSSEVEAGTVFTVHLPLEAAEDREVLAASA